jgi:chlorobactene glucosyltransferase
VILIYITVSLLLVIALVSVINAFTFPRLQEGRLQDFRKISILVPARNEASHIEDTISRLLQQDYPDFEVLLLDDRSSDRTVEIARAAAGGDPRLRIIQGQPLLSGWTGKNWACHQLAIEASGEILLFTDADVRWESQALTAAAALMAQTRAEMFTIWPTQLTQTWSERLVIPLFMFVLLGYLPEILVRHTPWASFAAANGQCLVFDRAAYARIGGHLQVKGAIIEDVALARAAKMTGSRLVMALGDDFIQTRMYSGWQEVREGFGKNILAGHAGQPGLLLISTLVHWTLFLFPWLWLLFGWIFPEIPGWPELPALMAGLGFGARLLTAGVSGLRMRDALLMPVSVLLMTVIAAQALWWHYRDGGPRWKGRTILRQA